MKPWYAIKLSIFVAIFFVATITSAQAKTAPQVELTPHGQQLEAQYAATLKHLRHQISQALPTLDPGLTVPFMRVYRAEAKAQPYRQNNKAYAAGIAACMQVGAPILDMANPFLASTTLQAQLIKASVIADGTPAKLAAFAQQSPANEALINQLLNDPALMKQMQVADGARNGDYGRTMQIYTEIQRASPLAAHGILQRLAMGTSLEQEVMHDGPPKFYPAIDPVARFLNFQKAYLHKELDPQFPIMTTWDCRRITNDPYSDQEADWFRTMLRNYEPEYIFMKDYGSRYMNLVHTDVGYSHPNWSIVPGLYMQKILAGGGECGPRAFISRLAERSFGIPTWGFREPGHGALAHWTPNGWVVQLGGPWEWDSWNHHRGSVFYRETQARRLPKEFMMVLRAQWVGAALGEEPSSGLIPGKGGLWYALADNEERTIVASGQFPAGLTDTQLAKIYGPTQAQMVENAPVPASALQISIDQNGVIHIPAVACSQPVKSLYGISYTKSFLGGMQMHCNVTWNKPEQFSYIVNAPRSATYNLTANVVIVRPPQHLLLTVNHAASPIDIPVPYTAGMWKTIGPVAIKLTQGNNQLHFERAVKSPGLTIKDFTLTPVQ
ncbi:MAG: hypothetical protein HKL96_10085 [Phycisphaerales bacterium]|nr:hypothetical protein [Phycisphaerales bacterium]